MATGKKPTKVYHVLTVITDQSGYLRCNPQGCNIYLLTVTLYSDELTELLGEMVRRINDIS